MTGQATEVDFGPIKITMDQNCDQAALKSFIDDITSDEAKIKQFKSDPVANLNNIGINVSGDLSKLDKGSALAEFRKNGLAGVFDTDLNIQPGQQALGPVAIIVIIVLIPA